MKFLTGLLMGAVLLFVGAVASGLTTQPVASSGPIMGNPYSVVTVSDDEGHGSGFYIGDGQFITAAHVATHVGVGGRMKLHFENPKTHAVSEFSAVVVWIDAKTDTALLKSDVVGSPEPHGIRPADLACGTPNDPVGTPIVSIGYPLDLGLRYSWGHVASGIFTLPALLDPSQNRYLGADISIAPGNSGGPLFDPQGRVVGLADAFLKFNTLAALIPRSDICSSIQSHSNVANDTASAATRS